MRYRGEDFAVLTQPRDCRDLSGLSCNIRAKTQMYDGYSCANFCISENLRLLSQP